ncbi:MAG: TIGR01777 family oxidoreductase [Acidimicrobiales bacterium]
MEVGITGASGLIGSALARSLRADGHVVRPLVRPAANGPQSGADAIRWDPVAGTIERDALDGVDVVVHLAGAGIGDKRWSPERKREIRESRVQGTDLLASTLAGLSRPPAVFVSGSAVGYYGDRGDEELTEQSAPGADFLAEVVQAWEAAAQPAVDAGIRTVFLRNGVVLAADGGMLPRLVTLFRSFVGGRLGSGRQWLSWVSIDDEVGVIRFLFDRADVSGPVNVTGPTPATNAEFTKALGAALHRPTVVPVPAFGPRLVLGREMADELLFVSQRAVPAALTAAGYDFAHRDVATALRAVLATRP